MNLEIEAYEGELRDLRKAAEIALEALEANLGKWAAKTPAIEALRQVKLKEKNT